MKSSIIIGIIIIILASFGFFYFFNGNGNEKRIEVQVEPVRHGKFTASTLAQGKLIATRKQQLTSLTGGIVFDMNKSIGEFLPKETVIATIKLLEPELNKKRRTLEYALLDLEILEEQVEQSKDLLNAKAVSKRQLQELNIKKYKQEQLIQDLRREIRGDSITTTFSGLLVSKFFHNGDHIDPGTVLALIIDTTSYAVEILAYQHQISAIYKGQTVAFTSQTFQGIRWGRVLEIERAAAAGKTSRNGITQTAPQFKVTASIKVLSNDNIFLGSQVEARFILQKKANTLFIPLEAILYRDDTTMVYIFSEGMAQRRLVTPGLSNDRFIEIISGLTAADTVITRGNLDIKDGDHVSIIN